MFYPWESQAAYIGYKKNRIQWTTNRLPEQDDSCDGGDNLYCLKKVSRLSAAGAESASLTIRSIQGVKYSEGSGRRHPSARLPLQNSRVKWRPFPGKAAS